MKYLYELDNWTAQLDRDIAALRDAPDVDFARTQAMVILDSNYAELRAVNAEVQEQAHRLEQVVIEGARLRARYEALSSLLTAGVVETDDAGVIVEASGAAAKFLNVRADYLKQKPLLLFIAEEDRRMVLDALRMALDKPLRDWKIQFQPRNGTVIPTTVSVSHIAPQGDERATFLWLIRGNADHAVELQGLDRRLMERRAELSNLDQSVADRRSGVDKLSRRVVALQEFEGQRLARELRERFGQALTTVRLNVETLGRAVPEVRRITLFTDTLRLIESTLRRLREIYFEQSPPVVHGLGLVSTIRQLLARIPEPEKLTTSIEVETLPPLAPDVENTCVWVVREAIHNTLRYAGASRVHVGVTCDGSDLRLRISDDGRGFDVGATRDLAERAGAFGLLGMEERVSHLGGKLKVVSSPDGGTEIRAVIPINRLEAATTPPSQTPP